jgi:hypothetical protein
MICSWDVIKNDLQLKIFRLKKRGFLLMLVYANSDWQLCVDLHDKLIIQLNRLHWIHNDTYAIFIGGNTSMLCGVHMIKRPFSCHRYYIYSSWKGSLSISFQHQNICFFKIEMSRSEIFSKWRTYSKCKMHKHSIIVFSFVHAHGYIRYWIHKY